MRARVPVDEVVVAVDVALLVEPDEDPVDGLDVALVEGEALVARSRSEAPRRLNCSTIRAPYSSCHSQTRSTNASRPSSWRSIALAPRAASRPPPGSRSRRGRCRGSTSRAGPPCGRLRTSASWIVPFSAWPMCSDAGHVRRRDRDRVVLLAGSARHRGGSSRPRSTRRRPAPRPRPGRSGSSPRALARRSASTGAREFSPAARPAERGRTVGTRRAGRSAAAQQLGSGGFLDVVEFLLGSVGRHGLGDESRRQALLDRLAW